MHAGGGGSDEIAPRTGHISHGQADDLRKTARPWSDKGRGGLPPGGLAQSRGRGARHEPRASGAGEGSGVREVRSHLGQAMRAAVARLAKATRVPAPAQVPWAVPPEPAFGDLSTPLALSIASALGRRPREVAEEILRALTLDPGLIARVEVAGAGNHARESAGRCGSASRDARGSPAGGGEGLAGVAVIREGACEG